MSQWRSIKYTQCQHTNNNNISDVYVKPTVYLDCVLKIMPISGNIEWIRIACSRSVCVFILNVN